MPHTVLPFKREATDEQLPSHGGLALFGEFLQALTVPRQLDAALPAPGIRIGSHPSQFVEPLLLMLHGEGRPLEDLRQIREDAGLRTVLRFPVLPCGTCAANAVFLRIGVFTYNLFVRFKLLALPQGWRWGQVRTVRWRLDQMAGKVVRQAARGDAQRAARAGGPV